MAAFSKLIITNQGQALIAKMIAGTGNIEFTKVSVSNAVYTEEQLQALTELSDIKQTSPISKVVRTNDVTVRIEAAITNTKLTEGYYMRALGLYALDGESEILYAVTIETSGNCYMPPYNGITVSGAYVQLVTTVGNAENVTIEVNQAAIATIGDIRDLQEQIDNRLPLFGGTMDTNSKVTIPGENNRSTSLTRAGIRCNVAANGGWFLGIAYYDATDTTALCYIGAHGVGDELKYICLGGAYDDPLVKIMPDGTLVCNELDGNATSSNTRFYYEQFPSAFDCNLAWSRLAKNDKIPKKIIWHGTNRDTTINGITVPPAMAGLMSLALEEELGAIDQNNIVIRQKFYMNSWTEFYTRTIIYNAPDISNATDSDFTYGSWTKYQIPLSSSITRYNTYTNDTGWITGTLSSFSSSGTIQCRIVGKIITVCGTSVVLKNDVPIIASAPRSLATFSRSFSNIKECRGLAKFGKYIAEVQAEQYSGDNIVSILGVDQEIPAGTTGNFTITGFID